MRCFLTGDAIPFKSRTRKVKNLTLIMMPLEKHDLLHELPEHREAIHHLKMNNAHFARLFEEYHEVDREVHRIEESVETPSDDYTHDRKVRRLALKDELLKMIQEHG